VHGITYTRSVPEKITIPVTGGCPKCGNPNLMVPEDYREPRIIAAAGNRGHLWGEQHGIETRTKRNHSWVNWGRLTIGGNYSRSPIVTTLSSPAQSANTKLDGWISSRASLLTRCPQRAHRSLGPNGAPAGRLIKTPNRLSKPLTSAHSGISYRRRRRASPSRRPRRSSSESNFAAAMDHSTLFC
jgi:hypothetical protein